MEVLDEKTQRKLELAKCLTNIKPLQEEIDNLLDGLKAAVDEMTLSEVDEKKLSKLNFKSGMREGVQRVIYIIEGFKDELNEGKDLSQTRPVEGVKINKK